MQTGNVPVVHAPSAFRQPKPSLTYKGNEPLLTATKLFASLEVLLRVMPGCSSSPLDAELTSMKVLLTHAVGIALKCTDAGIAARPPMLRLPSAIAAPIIAGGLQGSRFCPAPSPICSSRQTLKQVDLLLVQCGMPT